MTAASHLVLHVWPSRWNLPSIDAACLEAIFYFQLTVPGRYSLVETADPDLSPNGQLPFLTHGQLAIAPLSSIVSYLSSADPSLFKPADSQDEDEIDPSTLKTDTDTGLSALHLSQRTAWRAYIEAQLGDLVAHSLFVLEPNFAAFTHGMLASMLPVPQRYYVPRRIRESYRPRLEAMGLWQIANEPEEREQGEGTREQKGDDKEKKIRRAFGQAKLVERACLVFDIFSRLLNDRSFIFTDRMTTIDLALASRILLLTHAPLPNPALKDLLTVSYPSLISHATRVHALVFPTSSSLSNPRPRILTQPHVNPLSVVKGSLVHLARSAASSTDESEETKRFRRYRWGWIALAVAGAVGYLATQGLTIVLPVAVKRKEQEQEEEFEEVIDDEDEELLDVEVDELNV